MTQVHADSLDNLRKRTSEKWVEYPSDVLPLFVAEMDYPLAPVIAQALTERIRLSDTGYVASPLPVGEAFAGFAQRRWGWEVAPDGVRTTTDVSVCIVESLRRAIDPGDGVVINPPVYPPFFHLVPEAGGNHRRGAPARRRRDVRARPAGHRVGFRGGGSGHPALQPAEPGGPGALRRVTRGACGPRREVRRHGRE